MKRRPRRPTLRVMAGVAVAAALALGVYAFAADVPSPATRPAARPATEPAAAPAPPPFARLARRGDDADARAAAAARRRDPKLTYRARFDAKAARLLTTTHAAIHVWTVPEMKPAMPPRAVAGHLDAADLSPDGSLLLAADGTGLLRVWRVGAADDPPSGAGPTSTRPGRTRPADEPLWQRPHDRGYGQAEFTPDGRSVMAVGRGGKTVEFLDAATGRPTLVVTDDTSAYGLDAALSADGSRLMTCSLGPTRVWSAATGKPVSSAERFGSRFAISPAGDRVAGQAQAGEVTVFDAATGRPLGTTRFEYRRDSQVANVATVAFAPDGRRFATSVDDLGVRLWDAATARPVSGHFLSDDDGVATTIRFTPDGRHLVLGDDYGASVWEIATGRRVVRMDGPSASRSAPPGLAVSPDGRYLAADFGGPVELWGRRR